MENGMYAAFRQSRKTAGEILFRKGNRLKLIEGILFCATFFIFAKLLEELCFQIAALPPVSDELKIGLILLGRLLLWLGVLLVIAPLVVALLDMAAGMALGKDVFLIDLFSPFYSRKNYRRALRVIWPVFWKAVVFAVLPASVFAVLQFYFPRLVFLQVVSPVAEIVLIAVWLLLALRGYARLFFLLVFRMQPRAARRANAQNAGNSLCGGFLWWICCLPQILLGFLTMGILLIADVIPRMMVSYFLFCGRMTDPVVIPEELNDE